MTPSTGDASWVRRERWETLTPAEQEGFVPLCPDAVFEVRSPSQSATELCEKMRSYLANGAHLAVLVDPYERAVEVHRQGRELERHERPTSVALHPEPPGFTLNLGPVCGG